MNLNDLMPYINTISHFFLAHQYLGVFFAGFIAFIESLAVIGSIIPGSIVMTIVGCLLGIGAIPISYTLMSIFIGAFVGDFVSYALGAYFKDRIKSHHWVQPYEHWIHHGEAFMRKHGALSILIGRFVGPMRSMIPMIAGIAQMNLMVFTLAIIPTIILWSIVYLTPGVLLGALSVDMGESLFSYFLSRSLLLILLFSLWHSLHTLIRILHPYINHIKPFIYFDSDDLTHLIKGLVLTIFAVIFIYSVDGLHPENHWLNQAAYAFFITQTTDQIVALSQSTSIVMGHTTFLLLNIATVIVLYHHRYIKLTLAWVLMLGGLFCITAAIKFGFHVPRPNPLLDATSFPSGHILLTTTLFLFLSSLVETKSYAIGSAIRRITFVLMVVIGYTRLILQAHWLSDVIFSCLLALGIWHTSLTWKR
ncbi:MAG: VTT domain-containing protein, partial [Pseudomonadota bacterium]|nr:VTT domain-containing protein [Pseudomonadota bacterium]